MEDFPRAPRPPRERTPEEIAEWQNSDEFKMLNAQWDKGFGCVTCRASEVQISRDIDKEFPEMADEAAANDDWELLRLTHSELDDLDN
jgi:hypothetical protein